MRLANILQLGIKELRGVARDPMLILLIAYSFTISIYTASRAMPETLNSAVVSIVDEDRSPVASRIIGAFYGPYFKTPEIITAALVDPGLDEGRYTFVLDIPPNYQRDLLAGRRTAIQVNIDATRMTQAFIGANYIQNIITGEVNEFIRHRRAEQELPIRLVTHVKFNPNLSGLWFGGVMEIVETAAPDSTDETGKWIAVHVAPHQKLKKPVTLKTMKADPALAGMVMIRQSRLSVSPVSDAEFHHILGLSDQ